MQMSQHMMDQRNHLTPLCKLADIGDTGKEVRLDSDSGIHWLMLFYRDRNLTAWRNACPHQGRALNWAPDKFLFSENGLLVCCHHGASFQLSDGHCVDGPCKGAQLTPVPVRIEDDQIFLETDQ